MISKKIKNPVFVNIREINENQDILKLLKDEKNDKIEDKGINYDIYKDEKEAIKKNNNNNNIDK